MRINIRDATSSDARTISKLFYTVFFRRGRILYSIFYPFLKRDIIKRIKDQNSVSFVGSYDGTIVSVFRSKKKSDHWFVDSFFIESGLNELNSGVRFQILKSWASFLMSNLKNSEGNMTLIFKSSVQKHVRGYSAVFKRLGYNINYTELDNSPGTSSKNADPSYTLKLTVVQA